MAKEDVKNKKGKAGGINPIVAGVTGAVVGAGVAVAASQALKDKKTRTKVKKTFTNVKDKTVSYVQNFRNDEGLKTNIKGSKRPSKAKVSKKSR